MSSPTVVSDTRASNQQHDEALVSAHGLCKRFGAQLVVNNVSLVCRAGEVVLVLGANGAGKSTLLRVIAGLTTPERGGVVVPKGVRIGYAGHYTGLYSKLSVGANLALYAHLSGVSRERLADLIRQWQLEQVQRTLLAEVSRGTQGKASLVRALMADPQVLLLDEPSSNLDESATDLLRSAISQRAAAGGVVLVATHDLARLGSVATRVVVIERGVVSADSGGTCDSESIEAVVERYRVSNR